MFLCIEFRQKRSIGLKNQSENTTSSKRYQSADGVLDLVADTEIEIKDSNDPRSYRVNSDKLLSTGFKPSKTVKDAIIEIKNLYESGDLEDKDEFYNLKWMQEHKLYDLDD